MAPLPEDEHLRATREHAERLAAAGNVEGGWRRLTQGLEMARRQLSVRDVTTAVRVAAWRAAMWDYSTRYANTLSPKLRVAAGYEQPLAA